MGPLEVKGPGYRVDRLRALWVQVTLSPRLSRSSGKAWLAVLPCHTWHIPPRQGLQSTCRGPGTRGGRARRSPET